MCTVIIKMSRFNSILNGNHKIRIYDVEFVKIEHMRQNQSSISKNACI